MVNRERWLIIGEFEGVTCFYILLKHFYDGKFASYGPCQEVKYISYAIENIAELADYSQLRLAFGRLPNFL